MVTDKNLNLSPVAETQTNNHIINSLSKNIFIFQKTAILISHIDTCMFLVNYDPLLKDIFPPGNNKSMINHDYIIDFIAEKDRNLTERITETVRDYFSANPDDKSCYFTFSIECKTVHHTTRWLLLTIYQLPLPQDGIHPEQSITYCQIENAPANISGNLTLFNFCSREKFYFFFNHDTARGKTVRLDETELQFFRLSSKGYSEAEIAKTLSLSIGTFKYVKSKILLQANAQSTAQIIALMTKQGLL